MRGGEGHDRIIAGAGNDVLFGEVGLDTLKGFGGDDQLYGGSEKDLLLGGAGNDILQGGTGADLLLGGTGADQFIYTRARDGGDIIRDFTASEDRLVFEGSSFGYGNQTGRIDRSDVAFDQARDADDHWIYVRESKTLFFDANGNAAGGRTAIATFTDADGMEGWSLWLV